MKIILVISNFIIPLCFLYIIGYAMLNRISIYDEFVKGAKEGIKIVFEIMPTLIGLMVAVGILRASGALSIITSLVTPVTNKLNFPAPIVPIAFMRTISSSATTGLILDLFKTYGPDSIIGRMTSVMMGCTETIFYTLSVYFVTINIKKTRYALSGALIANIAGIIASVYITYMVFS